jgi:hypothetical protein
MIDLNAELLDIAEDWDTRLKGLGQAYRTIKKNGGPAALRILEDSLDVYLEGLGVQMLEKYAADTSEQELDEAISICLKQLPVVADHEACQSQITPLTGILITYIWHIHHLLGHQSIWGNLAALLQDFIDENTETEA